MRVLVYMHARRLGGIAGTREYLVLLLRKGFLGWLEGLKGFQTGKKKKKRFDEEEGIEARGKKGKEGFFEIREEDGKCEEEMSDG